MFFVHIVIVQGGAQVRHHGRHRRGGHEVVQGAHEVDYTKSWLKT